MRSSGKKMMRWLLSLALLVLVLAIVFWAVRPSPYGDWLGLAGLYQFTPLYVIREWANRRLGPRTPLGFLSLFPAVDLMIAGALLTAVVVVIVLLRNPGSDGLPGSGLARPIRFLRPRGVSLRVRTILVIIAILALELGWEVVAWRAWRLRENYLKETSRLISIETAYEKQLQGIKSARAKLEAGPWLVGVQETYTAEAKAAILSHDHDRLMRDASYTSVLVAFYGQLRRKYEAAAEDSLRPIPPDPPLREPQPEPEPDLWQSIGEYDRASAGFDELIRLYPDYPEAHERRAGFWQPVRMRSTATANLPSRRPGVPAS